MSVLMLPTAYVRPRRSRRARLALAVAGLALAWAGFLAATIAVVG